MSSFTILFKIAQFTDPTSEKTIDISQLVAPGEHLVSLAKDTKNKRDLTTQAGENTQLLEDQKCISATCHGYPQLTMIKSGKEQVAVVSVIPLLRVSDDLMEAHLLINPTVSPAEPLTLEKIKDLLSKSGVVYGIEENSISAALAKTAAEKIAIECLCARGQVPLNGKDAELKFELEVGPIPGRELGDGSIDFRERNMFVPVAENQIIARKILATPGKAGMSLTGIPLPAVVGKDLQVKVSDEAIYNEDDQTVRATTAGILSIVGKDTIRVSSQQKIDGDIDYSTGNIRSHHAVHITGSIRPDFKVSTKADLLIEGDVQDATINSHGNIVVKGGILGPTSVIKVQGDADIHHIERSRLLAGGNVIIRGSSYYSTITANGNISTMEKTQVMGGELEASGSMTIARIGSAASTPCRIAIGVDFRRYKRYRDLQREYQELLTETKSWHTRHGNAKKSKRITMMEEEMASIERELGRFNLIAGTPEDSLGDPGCFYTPACLSVQQSIAAGTTIRIGNEVIITKNDLRKSRFSLDEKTGAITITAE